MAFRIEPSKTTHDRNSLNDGRELWQESHIPLFSEVFRKYRTWVPGLGLIPSGNIHTTWFQVPYTLHTLAGIAGPGYSTGVYTKSMTRTAFLSLSRIKNLSLNQSP
jgi:hypothetical protein